MTIENQKSNNKKIRINPVRNRGRTIGIMKSFKEKPIQNEKRTRGAVLCPRPISNGVNIMRDIVIKPRTPKWERHYLEKKEAEEYLLLCRDGVCHPIVRKAKKAWHFLKWSIKLLVPDFLIGHPNLWDNLKTLRKHPQFHPLRMALVAWMIFALAFGTMGIYSLQHAVKLLAASPVTDTFTDTSKIASSTNMTVSGGQLKLSVVPWTCGDTLTDSRDNKTYATVYITGANQCWMKQNINIGTRIAGTSNQTNNATIEKYCYSDTDANCDTTNNPNYPDGGLYQWDEAMQYAASCNGTGAPPNDKCTTPVQGICPSGWHIPSHYELTTLEKNVGSNPGAFPYDEITTGWLGTNEGTNLKPNGSSGFEGNLAGSRDTDGSFGYRGSSALVWSSLDSGSSAWSRDLYSGYASVFRNAYFKLFGFSVRCVQD